MLIVLGAAVLTACGDDDNGGSGGGGGGPANNTLPNFIAGSVNTQTYDGNTDDLLTAGLGKTGLASATPPAIANAVKPTAAELRRLAIYSNYRALVDMTTNGGYGRFWGPNVDLNGNDTLGEGKIAGNYANLEAAPFFEGIVKTLIRQISRTAKATKPLPTLSVLK